MQQFYGRAAELECSIREGNASVEREQFIERMEQLAEAISFFSCHPTYQNQLDSMVFFSFFFFLFSTKVFSVFSFVKGIQFFILFNQLLQKDRFRFNIKVLSNLTWIPEAEKARDIFVR